MYRPNSPFFTLFRQLGRQHGTSKRRRQQQQRGIISNIFARPQAIEAESSDGKETVAQVEEIERVEDLVQYASRARTRGDRLIQQACTATDPKQILPLIDSLSNEVCRVADVSQMLMFHHYDEKKRSVAFEAFNDMQQYAHHINATKEVYDALERSYRYASGPEGRAATSEEERFVALDLLTEQKVNGICLSEPDRRQLLHHHDRVAQLALQYRQQLRADYDGSSSSNQVVLQPDELAQLDSAFVHKVLRYNSATSASAARKPMVIPSAYLLPIAYSHPWETVRRQCYLASDDASSGGARLAQLLSQILYHRSAVARLLEFPSFAHYQLHDKVSGSPEHAIEFLLQLRQSLQPKLAEELQRMAAVKQQQLKEDTALQLWDTDLCMRLAQKEASYPSVQLTVDEALTGVQRLFETLFQVRFVQLPATRTEVWHPSVRKLGVFQMEAARQDAEWRQTYAPVRASHASHANHAGGDQALLGYLYLDLVDRAGKSAGAATFVNQTGCWLAQEQRYQVPSVTLSLTLPNRSNLDQLPLPLPTVSTLFHEFGHVAHALLGRTRFQHSNGTRGKLDFVETPSQLFELFLLSPQLLFQFNRFSTHIIQQLQDSANLFVAFPLLLQMRQALFDLLVHMQPTPDLPACYRSAHEQMLPEFTLPDTALYQFTQYTHMLDPYASCYYSYSMCRVFAVDIWDRYFAADPLNPVAGRKLRDQFLRVGGGIPPHQLLTRFLGQEFDYTSAAACANVLKYPLPNSASSI